MTPRVDLIRARGYAESLRERSLQVHTQGECMAFRTYADTMEAMASEIEQLRADVAEWKEGTIKMAEMGGGLNGDVKRLEREAGKLSYELHRKSTELGVAIGMIVERTPFSREAVHAMIQVKTDEI
jgi:phage host-nuclease inhibitor protein Gam